MAVAPSPARPLSSRLLDPTQEYRLETQALRLIETLFRPGDVVCLAWKVRGGSGVTRMHHDYRAFEQIVAQHRAGRGILRHLSSLNLPPAPVKESDRALFERRHRSDVYFCVNPLRPLRDPDSGEMVYRRRRAHVAAVRTVGMDMDDGGPAGLERLREDVVEGLLPAPHLIVQTSHGDLGTGSARRYHQRCHLLWGAADAGDDPAGFTVQAAEELIQRLAPRYGAAPDVRSGEHLLRVPGFFNCKAPSDDPSAIDAGPLGSPAREVHILDPSETGLFEPAERVCPADFGRVLERPYEPLEPLPLPQRESPPVLRPPSPTPPADPPAAAGSGVDKTPKRKRKGPVVLDEAERARFADRYARATRSFVRRYGAMELDYAAPDAGAAGPPPGRRSARRAAPRRRARRRGRGPARGAGPRTSRRAAARRPAAARPRPPRSGARARRSAPAGARDVPGRQRRR